MSDLIKMGLRNPVHIKADVANIMPSSLTNSYLLSQDRTDKTALLIDLINERCIDTKTIIFFNTCASVEYYNLIFKHLLK